MIINERAKLILIGCLLILFNLYVFISFRISVILLLSIVITLLVFLLIQTLKKQLDFETSRNQQLMHEKDQALEKYVSVDQTNQEYEVLINTFDGAIFSFDVSSNQISFIKGAEELYGYTNDDFNNIPNLWHECFHPDDQNKVENDERQLLLGQQTKIKFRILDRDAEEKWVIKIATPIRNEAGMITKVYGQMFDITHSVRLEEELKRLAYYDDLTDLPNRKSLDSHIEKSLSRSKRHKHNFTLMFVDLDNFKHVNDSMGHEAGDLLLKEVVKRIRGSIRDEDLISRIGGDEFIVVFEETNKDEIEVIATRILESVARPYLIHEQEANISLSIGISMYPDDGETKETLIDHADKAMYYAKNNGKNNFKVYSPDLNNMEFKKIGLLEKWLDSIQGSKIFTRP
ncbi:sensor domain-containing diguanylate cyclase [Bacillus suaedae]|uniref:Sensor domain-containing diguanylate cyclase n=1 Tax=Halalkalibacter suaedae TaxID=2822140 RepID=A0A940X0K4_9BACI|nr:sensor domain-containing diguanylate cyclase [Bacillus suaedae]MBP3952935.1 sensor domain-containing diguanylate cyclase [Bacillus suaedae]